MAPSTDISPSSGSTDDRATGSAQRFLPPLLFGVVVLGVAWAYWGLDLRRHTSVEELRALVESHAPYGPLAFMAVLVAMIFTHVPMIAQLTVAAGGIVFGGPSAIAYAWVGSVVGTTGTFLLVRSVARRHVQRVLSGRLARLDERLARNGFWTVLALRLVFFLAPLLNWELGLTSVSVRDYVAATALGLLPQLATTVLLAGSIASGDGAFAQRLALGGAAGLLVVGAVIVARRFMRTAQAARHEKTHVSAHSAGGK